MPNYTVSVKTKLGSLRQKVVKADNESEAIKLAKDAFPLHDEVWIDSEASAETVAQEQAEASRNRIMELKRDSEITKAKSKRLEGLIWLGVGVFLTAVTFLFVRNAFIIAFGPVIWGGYIYKTAEKRLQILLEERAAGLPFIER